jgi:spoIIIJ-associated protein
MTPERSGEFRGKSVEAAVSSGLAALGLSREEVDVEVIRPGSRGLLGIGAEDAVVRLTALPAGKRAEAAPRPEQSSRAEQAPRSEPEPRTSSAPFEGRQSPRSESRAPQRSEDAPRSEGYRQETRRSDAPRSEGAARGEGYRGENRRSPREEREETRPRQAPRPEPTPRSYDASAEPTADEDREAVEIGREMLAGLLERMNMPATVEIVPQSEAESEDGELSLVLNIVGDDLGVLIGRQSEVLTSLQFILRLMVNQQTHGRTNLVVDVNGYKAKRADSLHKLALRTAEQVVQTGRTMALEPMPPAERRIIHLALRNHDQVETESVGEGGRRKVTVMLKKQ